MPFRARSIPAVLLLAAAAGCASPSPIGSVDLDGGTPVMIMPGRGNGVPMVAAGAVSTPLNGFRQARLIGAWTLGGAPVLVVRGRTAGCDSTWDVVVVRGGVPAVHTINACERTMRVTALPGSIEIASNDPEPRVWRFAGDTLLGPLPLAPDPAMARPVEPSRRRRRPVQTAGTPAAAAAAVPVAASAPAPPHTSVGATGADEPALPPISEPVGTDVIPPTVPAGRTQAPTVPLQ